MQRFNQSICYLNSRNTQEECVCRQTLLYPTIDGNYMYIANKRNGSRPEASDIMIYSPNVLVIRDNNYNKISFLQQQLIIEVEKSESVMKSCIVALERL